jgi:tetratricopeptide (TPR) repeat protein/ADP-heptose:LPS heptosyltransferase
MRLFRQTSAGDWGAPIAEVAKALRERVENLQEEKQRAAASAKFLPHTIPDETPAPNTATENPPPQEIDLLVSLFAQQRFDEGRTLAIDLTERYPTNSSAWKALGVCLTSLGQKREAVEALAKAARFNPNDAEAYFNLGTTLNELGRWNEAECSYRRAIELRPSHIDAYNNMGIALKNQGFFSAAAENYRHVIRIRPKHAGAYINLGAVLIDQYRLLEAESCYREAIEFEPEYPQAHCALGTALQLQGYFAEAEYSFRHALELQPGQVEANYNLGFLLLSLGRYAEGWPYCEVRYHPDRKDRSIAPPDLPFPQWQGEPLAGKSLIVLPEQGFGDEIQFARYLAPLKACGVSHLTFVCRPTLMTLLQPIAGADAVISYDESFPAHDYWVFLLSIPLYLGTTLETIPAKLPYLSAAPQRVARWSTLLPTNGFKVGLAWKGRSQHKNDANRSLSGLATLAPLWSVPGVSFVSLQKGQGEEEATSPPSGQPILPLGAEIHDFADTAAIVAQLDLVICVDTSIAHLAGALGQPCWVMLPAVGTDWRWLHERSDSPWYPGTMRLFRQTSAGDWGAPIAEVAKALRERVENLQGEKQRAAASVVATVASSATSAPHAISQVSPETAAPNAVTANPPPEEIDHLISLFARQRFDEGMTVAIDLTKRYPSNSFAWKALGACLTLAGRKEDAIEPMRKAALLNPDDLEGHLNLAIALKQQDRMTEAEHSYRQIVRLQPDHVDAHTNLGRILSDRGLFAAAENSYRRALELQPDRFRLHGNLGNVLKAQGHLDEAENSYRRALALKPDYLHAHFNLGVSLQDRGRLDEAEHCYRKVIDLKADHVQAYINLGTVLTEQGRLADAEQSYRRVITLRPEFIEAQHNLGILLLSLGRYREGWPYYEARYRTGLTKAAIDIPKLAFPQWQGEPLADKTLAVWPEQGLGDEIQFVRYLPLLKELGLVRLTLICQPSLKPLLQSIAGVDAVLTTGEQLPHHDYWVFPLSLPLHFSTTLETIPSTLPYLSADPQRIEQWHPRLPKEGFKVGLVWRGNAAHQNDANRSLPGLAALAPLWAIPGVSFVGLQKGVGEEEAGSPHNDQPILALGKGIGDFADTAAIVAQLDLVICVDTSIAHLAGALGQPCWVMLPAVGTDWRWLYERSDSPWYPGTMRLFRQTSAGDWGAPVAEVAKALRERVENLQGEKQRAAASVVATVAPSATSAPHAISDETAAPNTVTANPPPEEIDHLISLFARQRFDEGMTVAIALTERYPSNSFAWKALGACLTSTGREAEAIEPMRKAAALNPDDLEAHLNLALALKNQDRMTEAEHSYRQIVRLQPDHVDAHTNLGRILSDQGLFAAAENSYRRALELKPDRFRLHGNLGNVLKAQGRLDEAENSYRRALALKPDYLHAYFNLGIALQDRGRLDEAEHCYRKVIDLKADHVQAYINLGTVLTEQGRLADAEQSNRRALELKPDYVEAHINLANVLRKQHRLAEAESSNRKALALQPDSVYAHSNLGNILLERKRFKDAESSYCRAIELDPAYAQAHGNLGNTLKEEQGRFTEAEASYRRAIALDADYAQARSNLGILLLSLGRYTEGWPYYEARYDPKQDEKWIALPELPFPQWQGESLLGKSILLWPEQGLGDEIQFARYAPVLKERGVAHLTLVCTAPLKTLLQTVAGVDHLITQGEPILQHDYWAFPLSLPLHLGTTLASIPADLPYLGADPQRMQQWQARLPEDGLKVGLVWRGNAQHQNDANRSLPGLASLAPLWAVAGVKFVSLQKGPAEAEAISPPNGQPIVALGENIHDFADSAALVAQLDLVICVDTSVAHLAGALGKPCWVMLPAVGTDWRWLHERSDSPWYPGVMRLFRQTTPESWDATIAQVAQALHAWAIRRAGERSNG